jgi:lysozyme family protein
MADRNLVRTLIDRLFKREGGYSNDPDDAGGRTYHGISERAHPEAWQDGTVTPDEEERIYDKDYLSGPGIDKIPDPILREQVFDFGVNAGTHTAVSLLQRLVGAKQDGMIGPDTLHRIAMFPSCILYGQFLPPITHLNLAYETARCDAYARLVKAKPSQAKFLVGWLARATSFRSL